MVEQQVIDGLAKQYVDGAVFQAILESERGLSAEELYELRGRLMHAVSLAMQDYIDDTQKGS